MMHQDSNNPPPPATEEGTEDQQPTTNGPKLLDYDIEKILYNFHQIFLYGAIDEKLTPCICEELVAMDAMNQLSFGKEVDKYVPITMRIWSPGGYVSAGLAIIDTIDSIQTPVVTMVTGQAASMATIITVVGDMRIATKNSYIMLHPMSSGMQDYLPYMKDQMAYTDKLNERVLSLLKENTKLRQRKNKKIIEKAENGEVWMSADEALQYGLVDHII
jgi:ATP-dependent Clp protease protease subunit